MRQRHFTLFIIVLSNVLFMTTTGFGFLDSSCGREWDCEGLTLKSGAPAPKTPHKNIRMVSQDIVMRLEEDGYQVYGVFNFFNEGQTIMEWVGFPMRGNRCRHGGLPELAFRRFDAWVNGRKVELVAESPFIPHEKRFRVESPTTSIRKGREKSSDRWLVIHVTFPSRVRTTIRVDYEGDYEWSGNPITDGISVRGADYLIGTSSYWAGDIKRFSFTIDASRIGGAVNLVGTFGDGLRRMTKNLVRYEAANYEPDPKREAGIVAH